MLSLRLPEDIETRLERLARETGGTKSHFARAAIVEKIEDLEDMYLAEKVLDRVRDGRERALTSEEMWRGMDD